MANLREYRDEDGKLKAFYIRVYRGRCADGKQLPPFTDVFKVPETWSESTARRKARDYAAVFEERCLAGLTVNSNQTLRDYAEYVIELKSSNKEIVHSTEVRYREFTDRIYSEIGHIKLKDLKPQHLNRFYEKLKKDGTVKVTACAKIKLQKIFEKSELGATASAELVSLVAKHISASTVSRMLQGEAVQKEKAEVVAIALGYPVDKLFSIQEVREDLSNKTIRDILGVDYDKAAEVLKSLENAGLIGADSGNHKMPVFLTYRDFDNLYK